MNKVKQYDSPLHVHKLAERKEHMQGYADLVQKGEISKDEDRKCVAGRSTNK